MNVVIIHTTECLYLSLSLYFSICPRILTPRSVLCVLFSPPNAVGQLQSNHHYPIAIHPVHQFIRTELNTTATDLPPHSVRFVKSVRGNTVLELNGQMFTLNQRKCDTFYWECVKKRNKALKCTARIVTVDGQVKSVRGVHNHRLKSASDRTTTETPFSMKRRFVDEEQQRREEDDVFEWDADDDGTAGGHDDGDEVEKVLDFML